MYAVKSCFASSNRTLVNNAPTSAGCHRILRLGRNLYSAKNIPVMNITREHVSEPVLEPDVKR